MDNGEDGEDPTGTGPGRSFDLSLLRPKRGRGRARAPERQHSLSSLPFRSSRLSLNDDETQESEATASAVVLEEPEEEEEDFYQREARLNPVDNRTGRRTRRRSGPGPPTPESRRDVDLVALRERPNTYNGIPEFPRIVAYPVNSDGTIDPEIIQIMRRRRTPEFVARIRRELMEMLSSDDCFQGLQLSNVSTFLKEQFFDDLRKPRFFKKNLDMSYKIEGVKRRDDEILQQTSCPVCLEICTGEIYRCVNLHIICGNCQASLADEAYKAGSIGSCPTCRAPGIPYIRVPALEGWVKSVIVYCGFHSLGCNETGTVEQIEVHRKQKCAQRSWICYFCDIRVTLTSCVPHLAAAHSASFQVSRKFASFNSGCFDLIDLPLKSDDYHMGFAKFIVAKSECFILTQIEVSFEKFIYFVFKVDSDDNANEYFASIKIMLNKPGYNFGFQNEWSIVVDGGQKRIGKIVRKLGTELEPGNEFIPTLDLKELKHVNGVCDSEVEDGECDHVARMSFQLFRKGHGKGKGLIGPIGHRHRQ